MKSQKKRQLVSGYGGPGGVTPVPSLVASGGGGGVTPPYWELHPSCKKIPNDELMSTSARIGNSAKYRGGG